MSSSTLRKPSELIAPDSELSFPLFTADYIRMQAQVVLTLEAQSAEIVALAQVLLDVVKKGGRVYTFGNGGSACDAMHFAEELVARYLRERPGIRAQHLIDSGTMTCWANDYDFSTIFSRQVETLATADDAVVGFTTSGNSNNILLGIEAGNKIGAQTIVLTGRGGGVAKDIAKHAFIVNSDVTSYIQVAHMIVIHLLCDLLEQWMFPNATTEKSGSQANSRKPVKL